LLHVCPQNDNSAKQYISSLARFMYAIIHTYTSKYNWVFQMHIILYFNFKNSNYNQLINSNEECQHIKKIQNEVLKMNQCMWLRAQEMSIKMAPAANDGIH
jgi:hypothetical protein